MSVYTDSITLHTRRSLQALDITQQVNWVVRDSKVEEGTALVFTTHTTTAVTINEGERRLLEDIEAKMKDLAPQGAGYKHDSIDHNAHAHLAASIVGSSVTVPVRKAKLDLGTWQSVLFLELDGPRERHLEVVVQS